MVYYKGPVTDHFDGRHFFNPHQSQRPTFKDFLRWQKTRKKEFWPSNVDIQEDLPPVRVEGKGLRASFIGQATYLLQTGGLNILTDPFYSKCAGPFGVLGPKRASEPGIAFHNLPSIDVILLSHSHYDHMDLPALKKLHEKFNPLIITPLGNDTIILKAIKDARVIALDWGEGHVLGDMIFHMQPAYHWSSRTPFDRCRALWGAFVIEAPSGNIYFAGDTGFGEGKHFQETQKHFLRFRLALIPIGAYEPRWFMRESHMNPKEAFEAHKILNAQTTLGMHFETVQLTDEAFEQPRQLSEKIIKMQQLTHFKLPKIGESFMID